MSGRYIRVVAVNSLLCCLSPQERWSVSPLAAEADGTRASLTRLSGQDAHESIIYRYCKY